MKKSLLTLIALVCLGFTMNAQVNLQDGLVAYYPFNGNANDESGNGNNGNVVNAILSIDRFGNTNSAYSFDGNNGTERYIFSNIGQHDTISFIAWFKSPYPTTYYPTIINFGTSNKLHISILGNHPIYINNGNIGKIYTLSEGSAELWSNTSMADNNWHFIVVSFVPNDSIYLYVDNQLNKTTAYTSNNPTDGLLFIGRTITELEEPQTHESHFNGFIDDVRIYNRTLNEEEIQALYTEGQTVDLENGLVGYWPFNGNASDLSGSGNNGIICNATLTTDRFGQPNSAFQFVGNDNNTVSYIIANHNNLPASNSPRTISVWLTHDTYGVPGGSGNDGHPIICYGISSVNSAIELLFYTNSSNNNFLRLAGIGNDLNLPFTYDLDTWYHVVATYNGAVANVYVNNSLLGSGNFATWNTELDSLKIGTTTERFRFHNGKIDDIRIYDRVLSEAEIFALYNESIGFVISTPTTYAHLSTPIEVDVTTSTLTLSDAIYSYQFVYEFDEAVLEYTGYNLEGTIAEGGELAVNTSTSGQLAVSYMRETPLVGSGELINFHFDVISDGVSPLTISNFMYNETSVTSITNGQITVVPPTTASVSYSTEAILPGIELLITATFSNPLVDSPAPKIALSGANTLTATEMSKESETIYTYLHTVGEGEGIVNVSLSMGVDIYGFEIVGTPTEGENFDILSVTYGDITGNDEVTAYDAALTLMYSVGIDPMPEDAPLPWELWRILSADVDGTEGITAYDASLILQYSVGLITTFPVEETLKANELTYADISITVEESEIVFVSIGELYGLNIFVYENFDVLGDPQMLLDNALFVKNITEALYAFGVATAYAPADNSEIIRIPFSTEQELEVTFDMSINSISKSVTVGLPTGIVTVNESAVILYPNPSSSILFLNGVEKANITIFDVSGRMLQSHQQIENQIDVSSLPKGIYTVRIVTQKGTVTSKFVKN
jgi:hypothetical protein